MRRWYLQPLLLIATCGLQTRQCSSFSLMTAPAATPSKRSPSSRLAAAAKGGNGGNVDDDEERKPPRRSRSSSARAQSASRVSDGLKGRQTARRLSSKAKQKILNGGGNRRPPKKAPSQERKERHIRESSCSEAASLAASQSETTAASVASSKGRMPKSAPPPAEKESTSDGGKQGGEGPRAQRCGYCGRRFDTRSKLFRHLREDNSCRKLAISHGMPLENPYKTKDRRLRRVYGDVLLAGCIVLYRKAGDPISSPVEMAFKRPLYADDDLFKQYEVVLVRNAGGRKGFPKGKIELSDESLLGAALRETWEEAGLRANQLKVLPAWAAVEVRKRECAGENEDDDEEDDEADDDDDEEEEEMDEDGDDDDEDDDDEEDEEDVVLEQQRLSPKSAYIDVREITGRLGKRARYFVCAVLDENNGSSSQPKSTKFVSLTNKNDVDRDIEEVKWMRAHDAMKELGSKRRTALRRALAIHEVYFEAQQPQQDDEKPSSPRRV